MTTLSYSIAIRTLGTAGEKFRLELESICSQTVQPERVLVYIADGYDRPGFTVGQEEYIWVKKGMVAQRALRYDEISSDCVLMLDDDVLLAPDSAERMLLAMMENNADCIGADVFQNHLMPLKTKVFAAMTNLVFPHWSSHWSFMIHRNGSFSYNISPKRSFYWSQSSGGPAMLWRKEPLLRTHLEDELWLDNLGFAYGDDMLAAYKLHSNSGQLGILYNAGVTNLDAQSSSGSFRKSAKYIYVRTKASFMIWWRTCFKTGKDSARSRVSAAFAFGFKTSWLFLILCVATLVKWDRHLLSSFCKGLHDGWKAVHTITFQHLPPYVR